MHDVTLTDVIRLAKACGAVPRRRVALCRKS